MKQILKLLTLLLSLHLYSQDVIEMKYEKYVMVNVFNNFGDQEPSEGEIGEFIFSPMEKKLTIYRRDISNPAESTKYEYTINNSVFLLHGTTYNLFGQNETDLFDFRGKLAGRIEYNAETKILAFTNWDRGKVFTKKFWITSANIKPLKINSNPKQIPIQEADVVISRPNLNQNELFGKATDFINKFYRQPKIINLDSSQKSITLESFGWDVFNRNVNIYHRPIVEVNYLMTITTTDGNVKVNFQHINFLVNNMKYYLNIEDVMSEKETPLLFKEDKKGYIDYYKRIIKSLEYYIDNEQLIYFPPNSGS